MNTVRNLKLLKPGDTVVVSLFSTFVLLATLLHFFGGNVLFNWLQMICGTAAYRG